MVAGCDVDYGLWVATSLLCMAEMLCNTVVLRAYCAGLAMPVGENAWLCPICLSLDTCKCDTGKKKKLLYTMVVACDTNRPGLSMATSLHLWGNVALQVSRVHVTPD